MDSLTNLEELYLQSNQIPSTSLLLPLNLKILDLSLNILSEIPSYLISYSTLTQLNLSQNAITSIPFEYFQPLPNLKICNLANNSLKSISADIVKLQELEELDISENSLIALPEDMSKLTKLKKLFLHSSKVTVVITRDLPESLEYLSLMNMSIDSNNCFILFFFLTILYRNIW